MKAYSYIRFSTPEQSQGDSKRRQTDLAADYVKRHGLTLDTDLSMTDLGISAFKGKNLEETAALGAFRKAVADGLVERGSVLLVESLDRISRQNQRIGLRILEDIVLAGVDVVTLNDGKRWDKTAIDGFDLMMAFMMLFRAHEESSTKSKRNKAAWETKRTGMAAGKVASARTHAWLDVQGDASKHGDGKAKFKLNADKVKIVRRIFAEFNSGKGVTQITTDLNRDKIATWGGGKCWWSIYVRKILESRAVLGEHTPKIAGIPQAPIAGYFPAVVDETVWGAAAARRAANNYQQVSTPKVSNILSRLAVCPKCGQRMTRVTKPSAAGTIAYLVCAQAKHAAKCQYRTVRCDVIESTLKGWDGAIPRRDVGLTDAIKNAEGAVEGLESQIENLVDAIAGGNNNKKLAERLAAYESDLDKVNANLAALTAKAGESDSRVLKRRADMLKAALHSKTLDVEKVNLILREMLTQVVVDYVRDELVMTWKHDGVTRLNIITAETEFKNFTRKARA